MSPNFSLAKNLWVAGGIGASLILFLFVIGCGGEGLTSTAQASAGTVEQNLAATTSTAAASEANADSTYLLFNQKLVEGLTTESVDLNDVDEVFWHIFSRLPDQVTVYPSENYYYFIMYTDRRQLWGNIRLAAGRRDRGVLSFAYFEFRETPYVTEPRISSSKFLHRRRRSTH